MPLKGYKQTEEHKDNNSKAHKGIKQSKGWCQKLGDRCRGENNWHWKGGEKTKKVRRCFYQKRREIRKKGNSGSHTLGEWETLKAQYNWTCPCCSKSEPEIKLTEDHIIPLSKGGSNNIENIQPLCQSCNSKKATTTIKY